MKRKPEKVQGKLVPAVRTGQIPAGASHFIHGKTLLVKTSGQESPHGRWPQQRISPQVFMARNRHDFSGAETHPALGTTAFDSGVGFHRVRDRCCGGLCLCCRPRIQIEAWTCPNHPIPAVGFSSGILLKMLF
ncbi:MAG: hypothetical protein EBZ05_06890 [Verrucomicrobia bacterium]|nr:hypothetical protein [Verrucomicrobiota bacterium]